MKDDGFMKMIHSKLPPETELAVEMRCREVLACEDIEEVKEFCIDLMKNHARSEAVLSTAMMRVIELESRLCAIKTPTRKHTGVHRVIWWIEQLQMHWTFRKVTKKYPK